MLMVKRHLKSINAPKTWKIARRDNKFITKNNPGGMPASLTTSISNLLKYDLKIAKNTKEVKHLIKDSGILVNGKRIDDYRHAVCFTDILSFVGMSDTYRLIIDSDGILKSVPIPKDEAGLKILKIIGKSFVKGKTQLNFFDGRNVFLEKHHYKVNDSVLFSMNDQIVKEHLTFEKGMLVLLYDGKHVGKIGTVHAIKGDSVSIKVGNDNFETKKSYAVVIGKDKPLIKLTK